MNKLFLETICEGYLYDKKCFDKTYADTLSDALLDSLKEIREEDINLYFQIAQMNQSQQRKLFISLLEFEQKFTDKYCDLLLHEEESLENKEPIYEFLEWAIPVATIVSILVGGRKQLMKGYIKTQEVLGRTAEKIGALLSKKGLQWKYRYIISYENEKMCYAKAGITPETMNVFTPISLGRDNDSLMPEVSIEQAKKLRDCFLDATLQRIEIFMDSYFSCLASVGKVPLQDFQEDKIMGILLTKSLSPICSEYHELAKSYINSFEELVNYLFEKHPQTKTMWLERLTEIVVRLKRKNQDKYSRNKEDFNKYKMQQKPYTKDKDVILV